MYFRHIFSALIIVLFINSLLFCQTTAWTVDTFAGTDRPVKDGGLGAGSLVNTPGAVVLDPSGSVIFADTNNHRVRKISATGTISTIAGTGIPGYSGDSGPAAAAQLGGPMGLAYDAAGNLYIADYEENVVRMVNTSGIITTFAGNGSFGNTGNGGKATAAGLNGPYALAFDKAGNLYIADTFNNAVRKVTPAGTISAFVPRIAYPEGLAVDASGTVYISAWGDNKIYTASSTGALNTFAGTGTGGFSGDGGLANAAALNGPQGLTFDTAGNLWICDSLNNRIREVVGGVIQTPIGSGYAGLSAFGSDPTSLSVYSPAGIAVDAKGTVFWSESGNQRVRRYQPAARAVTDLAGYTPPLNATGAPTSLPLLNPASSASDASGNIYIADTGNNVIRMITPAGVSSIIAGTGSASFNGEAGTATAINLAAPLGVSVDAQGNIFIADTGNGRVRMISPSGQILTVMGGGTALPASGQFAGSAFLSYPAAVAATGNGGFAVVDRYLGIAAVVNSAGTISVVPTADSYNLTLPNGVAVAGSTVYIADTFGHRILKYNGDTVSIAAGNGKPGYTGDGNLAPQANLFLPYAIATDSANNLYIADTYNNVIRMVDAGGRISTIAGNGKPGFSGDQGLAKQAQFFLPTGVNVDSSGNVEVADALNQRIRILQFQTVFTDVTIQTDAPAQTAAQGATVPFKLTLTSAGGFAGSANIAAVVPSGITVTFSPSLPVNLSAGQSLTVTASVQVDPSVAPGSYSLVFALTAGSIQHSSTVTLQVVSQPQFTSDGVVNAASYATGGVAPGEIIAIYGQSLGPAATALGAFDFSGQLSTQVGGAQVLFDGVPAPLIYVLAGQLSAIVPYSVAGKTTTQIQIQNNGQNSAPVAISVVDAAPAIFTLPQSAQAAALNADLSTNGRGNPAAAGTAIVLFATGEGQTSPAGVTGKLATTVFPVPVLPVTVTIGGVPAKVLYAGAAPYEVAGVFQVNAQIPPGTPSGSASVVIQVGTRQSSAASIAVK